MALVAVFTALGTTALTAHSVPVPLASPLSALPMQVDNWIGGSTSALPPQAATWWPGADETVSRLYRRLDGAVIDVYVGYFASQEQGRELASYRSAPLLRDATARRVTLEDGSAIDVAFVRRVQGRPLTAIVWYEMDSVHHTELAVKASTMWSALTRNRSNGAAVMLSVASWPAGRSSEESLQDLDRMAAFVHTAIGGYLRGEHDRRQ
jgi:EpsI family protein